jgi:hypothetical protein
MLRYLLIPILFLFVGCSSTGIEITDINNHIHTPNYSITVPKNRGWKKKKDLDNPDLLYMEKHIGPNTYIMRFSTNMVVDESMKLWTAKQVADDYRKGEQVNMMVKGTLGRPKYQLKDVTMGEEKVGDKQFFTMRYTTISSKIEQKASLYLYFPDNTDVERFFVSVYSEAFPLNKPPLQSLKDEFLETLNSLEMADKLNKP